MTDKSSDNAGDSITSIRSIARPTLRRRYPCKIRDDHRRVEVQPVNHILKNTARTSSIQMRLRELQDDARCQPCFTVGCGSILKRASW